LWRKLDKYVKYVNMLLFGCAEKRALLSIECFPSASAGPARDLFSGASPGANRIMMPSAPACFCGVLGVCLFGMPAAEANTQYRDRLGRSSIQPCEAFVFFARFFVRRQQQSI
jgi:hypothetical protein